MPKNQEKIDITSVLDSIINEMESKNYKIPNYYLETSDKQRSTSKWLIEDVLHFLNVDNVIASLKYIEKHNN